MKYHRGLKLNNSGVSLLEILIVLGILALMAGIAAPFTMNFYGSYQAQSEVRTGVALLRRARMMSMAGAGAADHGVRVASAQYTLFEGSSYASRDPSKDEHTERTDTITVTGPSEIVFARLSGKSTSSSWVFDNESKITVNSEGRVDW